MELRVLRYFLTLAREENITKAAELIHITQPTLSRQLAQLEEELGTRLFTRGKRRITLTEDGMLLRRRAEEIVELAEKAEQELGSGSRELCETITLGSGESRSAAILARIMGDLKEVHPGIRYSLVSGNADQLKERLEMGLMDAAILLEPVSLERYQYLRLPEKDYWGVLMPANDPMALRETVSISDLEGKPVLISHRASVRQELETWFGQAFGKLNVFATHNLIRHAAMLVENGLGYAVTIEGAVDIYDKSRLCFRRFSPEHATRSVLVWKKHRAISPGVAAFIECAKKAVAKEESQE